MSAYRFSWLRPGGWSRLGVAGAVAVLFATPMLWALGVFGGDDESIRRAVIFVFSGLWLFVGLGYGIGWALRGFMVRIKDEGEDGDDHARRPAGGAAHPPAHGPATPHRPGH